MNHAIKTLEAELKILISGSFSIIGMMDSMKLNGKEVDRTKLDLQNKKIAEVKEAIENINIFLLDKRSKKDYICLSNPQKLQRWLKKHFVNGLMRQSKG